MRKIQGIRWQGGPGGSDDPDPKERHVSTTEHLDALGLTDILEMIGNKRVTWMEHHLRNPDEVTGDRIARERKVSSRWWKALEKTLEERDTSWEELEERAEMGRPEHPA